MERFREGIMIQLVVAFICPIVLTIVGLYLKKHINTDRGKSGYITKNLWSQKKRGFMLR